MNFGILGHDLIDHIAEFLDSLPQKPITKETTPNKLQQLLGGEKLPEEGNGHCTIAFRNMRICYLIIHYSMDIRASGVI